MNKTEFSAFCRETRQKRLGLVLIFLFCAIGAGVTALLQCYFLKTQYHLFYAVYDYGSIAPTLLFWLAFGFGAAALLCAILLPKTYFCAQDDSPASVHALWLCVGIVQIAFCIYLLTAKNTGMHLLFTVGLLIFSLSTAVFCVMASGIFQNANRKFPLVGIYAQFGTLFFFVLRILSLYFDRTVPMTAPLKTIEIATAIALCLYLLCSLRHDLDIPLARLSWVANGVAFSLCTLSGVGGVYLWSLYPDSLTLSGALSFLYLAWAFLLGVKLFYACATSLFRRLTDYLVFGVLTTAVNFLTYFLLTRLTSIPLLIANVIAFVISVLFAYAVNKFFVFEEKTRHGKALFWESVTFFVCRILTLGIEELILWSFVYLLQQNDLLAKVIAAIVVVITNYLTGRFLVFGKKNPPKSE